MCTQTPSVEFCTRFVLHQRQQQDMCVYMWIICVGHVVWWNQAHPWAQKRRLRFSQVSLAQFLLTIGFIFSCQNLALSHEDTTRETMSDGDIFKAKKVFIKDSVEGGAGNTMQPRTTNQVSTTWALSMSCGTYDLNSFDILQNKCVCVCMYGTVQIFLCSYAVSIYTL